MQKRTLLELISMRKLLLILLSVLLTSCPAESNDIINLLLKRDRKSPTLTSYELLENRICMLSFDEIVTVTDARLDEESIIRPYRKSKSIWIEFSSPLLPGVEKKLFLTAEDDAGNTSRFALRLTGVNLRQAELLITEVSMKGTESSPDRIELTAMSSGSIRSISDPRVTRSATNARSSISNGISSRGMEIFRSNCFRLMEEISVLNPHCSSLLYYSARPNPVMLFIKE